MANINLGKGGKVDREELAQEAKEFEAYAATSTDVKKSDIGATPDNQYKRRLEYFSEERVALTSAMLQHKQLCNVINHAGWDVVNNWPEILGEVGAYCNVVLDGAYDALAVQGLYRELSMRLNLIPPRLDYDKFLSQISEEDVDPANWDKFLKLPQQS